MQFDALLMAKSSGPHSDPFLEIRLVLLLEYENRNQTHPIPLSTLRRDVPQFTSIVYYSVNKLSIVIVNFW